MARRAAGGLSVARGIERKLAAKVLQLTKQGGNVPPQIRGAARRILDGGTSPADAQALRGFMGITRTGATAASRGIKSMRGFVDKAAGYGVMFNAAMQEGAAGTAAQFGLVQNIAKDVEKVAKSKQFEQFVQKAAAKWFNDPVVGQRLAYKLRAGARMAGVAAQFAQFGVEATKGVVNAAEALGGIESSEKLRRLRSDAALANADSRAGSLGRRIANLRVDLERKGAGTRWIPLLGGTIASHATGGARKELSLLETRKALRDAGLEQRYDEQNLRDFARRRVLSDKYGMLGGDLAAGGNDLTRALGVNSADLEEQISAKVQETVSRALQLRGQMREAAGEGRFGLAQELGTQAEKELPGSTAAWRSPQQIWKSMEANREANHWWSWSQMAKAGPRTGD